MGIPQIHAPAGAEVRRPIFSVMIPTRNPTWHLEVALRSVLAQGLLPAEAQIAVVDDGSEPTVEARVRSLDPTGRIEIHRFPGRSGLAQNLNRAIALSRGRLVHLLHQDDYVLPGFYARMRDAFGRAPMLGMAFCRAQVVDHRGDVLKRTSVPRLWSGIVRNWVARIATRQRVQAPCAVVARSAYEQVGGFREDLQLALDWEMWVRVAVRYPVWCDVRALAAYRRHPGSETERLRQDGAAWRDVCNAIRINSESCRSAGHADRASESARWYLRSAFREACRAAAAGHRGRAKAILSQSETLLEMISSPRIRAALVKRMELTRRKIISHGTYRSEACVT